MKMIKNRLSGHSFSSSSQAATCPSVYHLIGGFELFSILNVKIGKLWISVLVFGLTDKELNPSILFQQKTPSY